MRRRWLKTGNCGQRRHDLRGIAGDRCPECGLEISVTAVKIAARARTRRRSAVVGIALALAAGERAVDGSLSDRAAVKAVVNQPMKHRIAPIAPTGVPDPHVMQELNGRFAALLSIPRVVIDRAYIARERASRLGREGAGAPRWNGDRLGARRRTNLEPRRDPRACRCQGDLGKDAVRGSRRCGNRCRDAAQRARAGAEPDALRP
jgi:hypothetical protein